MNPDGSGVKRVTFQGSFNTDPVWSPNGNKIAFVGRNGGRFDVFVVNIDGTGMMRLTQDMGDNEDPSWSPDGNYIAFSSTRTGSAEIWMTTVDGHHQVQLTKGGGYLNPNWSPSLEW
jgi:TolB protein